jgi:ferredoxin--NADP+ reductase
MYGPKHLTGVVTERRDITSDLWIVRVRPETRISFLPGQYITIGLPAGERLVERPYSVASAPQEPELEFFLEVVRSGKLSPHLYEVPVGGEVYVRPAAKGRFTFDDQSGNRNHFMAATVTGVAPFLSMVRHLTFLEPDSARCRIVILQAASISAELGYQDELVRRADQHRWFEYIPTISRVWLDAGWEGERGRVEDVARKHLDLLGFAASSTTVYLCGNPHMIRNMERLLGRAGFQKERIRKEIYWPAD